MQLVIAEKPSVARNIAKVLHATNVKDGYLEGKEYLVSWCIGYFHKEVDRYKTKVLVSKIHDISYTVVNTEAISTPEVFAWTLVIVLLSATLSTLAAWALRRAKRALCGEVEG